MIPTRSFAAPLEVLQREFDRAFNRASNWAEDNLPTAGYPVDIRETPEHVLVEAELPGFKRDEIDITLENRVLTISALRKETTDKNKKNEGDFHLQERRYSKVQRAFRLPSSVDENSVEASLKEGILMLKISKREEVKPRKIEVK